MNHFREEQLPNAPEQGDLGVVKKLLRAPCGGADPNVTNRYGRTPLHLASHYGRLEIVKGLLLAGADPNIADNYGKIPLYWASSKGYLEIVKELLLARADPNITDESGQTPLYWASRDGYLEIVKELLLAGTDPNIADENSRTPLNWASYERHLEIVELLENYIDSLHTLSLITIRKYKINIAKLPKVLLESQ